MAIPAFDNPMGADGFAPGGATPAFMFESRYAFEPTRLAMTTLALQKDCDKVWQGFDKAQLY